MGRYTTLLYATPSLMSGFARTLDLGATFDGYCLSATPEEADARAMAADFMAISEDFSHAVNGIAPTE